MDLPGAWHRVGSLFGREMPENVLVALEAENGLAGTFWSVVVREVWGGLEGESEILTWDGHAERIFKVSPTQLAAFWAGVEQLGSWNLTDRGSLATDLTSHEVFLRHGRRSLRLSCYGFIEGSPQRRLVRMIERLGGIDALFREAERQRSEP